MSLYRSAVPRFLRRFNRYIYKNIIYLFRFVYLLFATRFRTGELKIIIGAALTSDPGWISTNEAYLDITRESHWQRAFPNTNSISRIVSEHVFEHLTACEMNIALKLCYKYLHKGGTLLIAVPDGNHPNPIYQRYTGINGYGADAQDHEQFIKYEYLSSCLLKIGFSCTLLEGYSCGKLFSSYRCNQGYGKIHRTRSSSTAKHAYASGWDFPDAETSLIVLAEK